MTPLEAIPEQVRPEDFNQSVDRDLIVNMLQSGDFQEQGKSHQEVPLPLPVLELADSGSGELPPASEAVDFNTYKTSYDNALRICAGGTEDQPQIIDHGNGASTLFFTDRDGIPVVVQKRLTLIQDKGSPVPNRNANLVHKRIEFLNLESGITAAVELTPPTLEERLDHRMVSPADSYQISILDRNNGQAYKYSFPKSLGNGTSLKEDLKFLRKHHQLNY